MASRVTLLQKIDQLLTSPKLGYGYRKRLEQFRTRVDKNEKLSDTENELLQQIDKYINLPSPFEREQKQPDDKEREKDLRNLAKLLRLTPASQEESKESPSQSLGPIPQAKELKEVQNRLKEVIPSDNPKVVSDPTQEKSPTQEKIPQPQSIPSSLPNVDKRLWEDFWNKGKWNAGVGGPPGGSWKDFWGNAPAFANKQEKAPPQPPPSQNSAPPSDPNRPWWEKLLDKLSLVGKQKFDNRLDEAKERLEKTTQSMQEAPQLVHKAESDYIKASKERHRAKREYRFTPEHEEAVEDAREKLRQEKLRMRSLPQRLEEAKQDVDRLEKIGAKRDRHVRGLQVLSSMVGESNVGGFVANAANTAQLGMRAAAGDPAAVAQLADKAAKKAEEGVRDIGRGMGKMLARERAGEVLGGVGQTIEGIGKLTGDPLMEYFGKLTKVVGESVEVLRQWGDNLHNANMRFAEFSGHMAMVQAQQTEREIRLNQQRGDRRADAARRGAEAQFGFERRLAPIEDWWAQGQNDLKEILFNFGSGLLDGLQARFPNLFPQSYEGTGPGEMNLTQWVMENTRNEWDYNYGRPSRFVLPYSVARPQPQAPQGNNP